MSPEMRASLEAQGVRIISAAHALSAGERGLSLRFKGVYPLEIVAYTLRMFGQGTKVCVEMALMAADQGVVREGEPIMCLAGSAGGAGAYSLSTWTMTSGVPLRYSTARARSPGPPGILISMVP